MLYKHIMSFTSVGLRDFNFCDILVVFWFTFFHRILLFFYFGCILIFVIFLWNLQISVEDLNLFLEFYTFFVFFHFLWFIQLLFNLQFFKNSWIVFWKLTLFWFFHLFQIFTFFVVVATYVLIFIFFSGISHDF